MSARRKVGAFFPAFFALPLALVVFPRICRAAAGSGAEIMQFSGSAWVFDGDAADWDKLSTIPRPLQEGAKVRTGRESTANIALPDGSRIEMGADAFFTLEKAKPRLIDLILKLGKLSFLVPQGPKARRFQVQTPVAVLSVRGTQFEVDVNASNETAVNVREGVLGVKTVLGEEVELGPGRNLSALRIVPDRPLDLAPPAPAPKAAPKEEPKEKPKEEPNQPGGASLEEFAKDVRREVALGLSRDAVQSAAAAEARGAEYEEGKTMVDVNGLRVRIEEYVVRPAADQFKFVVLNERGSRFDYFYYQARFNQALPENLSIALRYLNGKTGAAPDYFITAFETGRSNTLDSVQELGANGHLVNSVLTADRTVYDPDANAFRTVKTGDSLWTTLFDNYTYRINGAEKYGWEPAGAANITAYDYVATGFKTRILGGGAACAVAGCATAGPVTCTAAACETAARPSSITQPEGTSSLHERVSITYAANKTNEVYDFYVVADDGRLATSADFFGLTSGSTYKNTLLQYNYQHTIKSSEFNGRTIDLVIEPKILVKSGLIP